MPVQGGFDRTGGGTGRSVEIAHGGVYDDGRQVSIAA
jgi:hypothetical protein